MGNDKGEKLSHHRKRVTMKEGLLLERAQRVLSLNEFEITVNFCEHFPAGLLLYGASYLSSFIPLSLFINK